MALGLDGKWLHFLLELYLFNLDLMEAQKIRRDKDATELADSYTFFYGNRNAAIA
jgi:hypothetical protein